MCAAPTPAIGVVWFKRDLRTVDHAPLFEAARRGPVLPLYIAEPRLWAEPDAAGRHWEFLSESLAELRRALAVLGQPLVIRVGDAVAVLEGLRHSLGGIDALWSHMETGTAWSFERDRAVAEWARAHGIPWREPRQFGVLRGPASRDGWARQWDRMMAEPVLPAPPALPPLPADLEPGEIPSDADLGLASDPCPGRQPGGRTEGLEVLRSFLHKRGADYQKEMSSPLTAFESCSRLSAHLAYGTLSMRELHHAYRARAAQVDALPPAERGGWPASLRSWDGRLHWHCHFMQKLESEPDIELRNLHPAYDALRTEPLRPELFEPWCRGRTGFPFVDACMRALRATGWINFRMRAMLMAFSSYHLWQHWRSPSLHLARLFTDYEPGIHYPQSQMQSGTTGINTVRIYNPVKQSRDQDPTGEFIRHWVPELAGVEPRFVHEPWTMDLAEQAAARCRIGTDYPAPIVDHEAAARRARAEIYAVRRGSDYREVADAIQARHGSRRSGIAPDARARRRPASRKSAQLKLGL